MASTRLSLNSLFHNIILCPLSRDTFVHGESNLMIMSICLSFVAFLTTLLYALPLNSPLLQVYDYISELYYYTLTIQAKHQKSSEVAQLVLP